MWLRRSFSELRAHIAARASLSACASASASCLCSISELRASTLVTGPALRDCTEATRSQDAVTCKSHRSGCAGNPPQAGEQHRTNYLPILLWRRFRRMSGTRGPMRTHLELARGCRSLSPGVSTRVRRVHPTHGRGAGTPLYHAKATGSAPARCGDGPPLQVQLRVCPSGNCTRLLHMHARKLPDGAAI